MLAIHYKFGISIKRATTILEVSALLIEFLFGGPLGLGTFIFCFIIGTLIELSIKLIKTGIEFSLNTKVNSIFLDKRCL